MCIRAAICAIAILAAAPLQLHAASNHDRLNDIRKQQQQAYELSAELKNEINDMVEQQQDLKEDLVELASELKKEEQRLFEIQEDQQIARTDLDVALEDLNKRRAELVAMIHAAARLSQVPLKAMVMMPEMSEQTLQVAHSMKIMADTLRSRAEALRTQIAELKKLEEKLEKKERASKSQLERVTQKRMRMEATLAKREQLVKEMRSAYGAEQKRIKTLAGQARSLSQLISKIEKEKKREEVKTNINTKSKAVEKYVEAATASGKKGKLRAFISMKGKLKAPSAGKIVGNYNKNSSAELSKGMTIETASRSIVTAPYDGQVAYTGSFRGYGNMIIIKHTHDYYTLLAGLGDISASEGETIFEGEPVGNMSQDKHKLYVELRKGNEPQNPQTWFRGL